MGSPIEQAKATLLKALEQLERAENDLGGEPDRVDLVVVYAMGRRHEEKEWHERKGFSTTSGPSWVHRALINEASEALKSNPIAKDPDD